MRQWIALYLASAAGLACSSEVDGGSGGEGGAGGGGGAPNQGGGGTGGEVEAFVATCAAKTTEESCKGGPISTSPLVYCQWWAVEELPDMSTCGPGPISDRCLAWPSGSTAGCASGTCAAEPNTNAYFYSKLDDGSVRLLHKVGGCGMPNPPYGFHICNGGGSDPEACRCRCEL